MKNKTLIAVIAGLFLNIFCARAQEFHPLTIGDTAKDIQLNNILNYRYESVSLSDLKGKFILLDFWATWCTPCIESMPHIDSLKEALGDELQIFLVTDEKKMAVSKFLAQNKDSKINQPIITGDKSLSAIFPHQGIPHYVWINKEGWVSAITGSKHVTKENLERMINTGFFFLPIKDQNRIPYDESKPLLLANQVKLPERPLYQSVLTGYIKDAPGGTRFMKNFINCTNNSIKLLYQLAYGVDSFINFVNERYRLILEGFETEEDSMRIGTGFSLKKNASLLRMRWAPVYAYNYEIMLDSTYPPRVKFEFMKQDLNRFFGLMGYQGRREIRKIKGFVLTRISQEDKMVSRGGDSLTKNAGSRMLIQNAPLKKLVVKLAEIFAPQGSKPFYNRTGYKNNVDMSIDFSDTNLYALNAQLQKYGLQLEEKEFDRSVIVITKTKISPAKK